MKHIIIRIAWAVVGVALVVTAGMSQHSNDPVADALGQLSSENVRGYIQPIVDGFAANLNSGIYHSPTVGLVGVHARFEVVGAATVVGEAQKHYYAVPPEPFEQTPVRTSTILGPIGTTVAGPGGMEYQFQNGQIRTVLFGLGVPQLTVGNLFGTEAIMRYAVIPSVKDFPSTSLIGAGLRHDVGRYIPALPFNVSVGGFWQSLNVGDLIKVRSANVSLIVGKTVSLFTVYGGAQYEDTGIDVHYTYTGYGSTPDSRVDMSYSSDDVLRFTTGFGINLVGIQLSTDVSIGRVTVVTGAVGLGF